VVGMVVTRGLQRSASASIEKWEWEWKGPSTPLGGAIVDSRGLSIVMSTIGGLISNTNVPLWQEG
jgi:hypothetical protein